MNEIAITGNKFNISNGGIEFTGELTRKEWNELGVKVARVGKSIGFIIGDWINYGEKKWGEMYADIIKLTDLDYGTLRNFAYVAARVQLSLRNDKLDFAHHMVVAKLKSADDQGEWLTNAVKHDMSVRRLRKSLNLGRVATLEDMEQDPNDKGKVTYMLFINRLCQWWRRETDKEDIEDWEPERKRLLKRDLKPLVEIYEKL
jgi:hypothetical protein